jgi:hypothetical protein
MLYEALVDLKQIDSQLRFSACQITHCHFSVKELSSKKKII